MDRKVVDELGLVLENQLLTVYIPATKKALVFRILSRVNRGNEVFNYGALPLSSGDTLNTYDAGTVSVPADGVIPARGYTRDGYDFPLADVYDEEDMWYMPKEYNDRLFHVKQYVTPRFLRCDVQIPVNITQPRFQRERKMIGIEADFGFSRGFTEVVHFPELHYGYRYGNDTNVAFYTHAEFVYAEYMVEIPKDADLIFNVLTRDPRYPSHWLTLLITQYDARIPEALNKDYGFEGFPVYARYQREKAIAEYEELLEKAKI